MYAKFSNMPIEKVAKDPEARAIAQNLFNTYCIQCHGSDAKGSKGFPNLTGRRLAVGWRNLKKFKEL